MVLASVRAFVNAACEVKGAGTLLDAFADSGASSPTADSSVVATSVRTIGVIKVTAIL
jgi:hypothetical protein